MCPHVCVFLTPTFVLRSLLLFLLFQDRIKIHLNISVFLEGSVPPNLQQNEYCVIKLKFIYLRHTLKNNK